MDYVNDLLNTITIMEHQDLLNALKGKRLYWRDEDNENDGVIGYITTTTKEGEYILLFDDFANVTMDRLHIEELAERGYTCDEKYSYNLEEPPIEYIRKALVGRLLEWGDETDEYKGVIRKVEENKETKVVLVKVDTAANTDGWLVMGYLAINELIAEGAASDENFYYTLLSDETPATATCGNVTYSDGIGWEKRLWNVYKHLYLVDKQDTKTALEAARLMVENYRKATEGGV